MSDIEIGRVYELRVRRRTVIVRVVARVVVRGEWWNCLDLETNNTRLAHSSEFVREQRDDPSPLKSPPRRRRRLTKATLVMAIMSLSYILSVGPAYGMHQRDAISELTFDTLYWPLLKLAHRHDSVHSLLASYSQWWV